MISKSNLTFQKIMTECKPFVLKFVSNIQTPTSLLNVPSNLFTREEENQKLASKERFERLIVKPTLPKLFKGARKQITTRITGRIEKDSWNFSDLRKTCDENYGKGNIILDHIMNVKTLNDRIGTDEKFLAECFHCKFIWITKIGDLNTGKKGCPWCKNKCKNIQTLDFYTVIFVGERIHEEKYQYIGPGINNENITCRSSKLEYQCEFEDHKIVIDTVSEHLSQANRDRSHGCTECYKNRERDPYFRQPYTVDNFPERSIWAHRDEKEALFDYSLITDLMKLDAYKYVPLICKRINNLGNVCDYEFWSKINDHINNASGCPKCFGSEKYTRGSFIEKMNERYTDNEFSYELIKEEDIKNKVSKPKVKCTECSFIISNTIISDFLHCVFKKECDNCYNHRPWNIERLFLIFQEREQEGIFNYLREGYDDNIYGRTKLLIDCLICKNKGYKKYQFIQSIESHFINNCGCPRCNGRLAWNFEKFEEEIPQYFLDNFDYSLIIPTTIVTKESIVPIICKKCKSIFHRSVHEHVKEFWGCTFCRKSNGEKNIYMYLKNLGLSFVDQLAIMGQNGHHYFYDFEVYHNSTEIIIEIDGFQHFSSVNYFHKTVEKFENARKRDIYKHYMALKNKKRIVRIDYTAETKIREHIDAALESRDTQYFSNPSIYQWLIEGVQKMFEENK